MNKKRREALERMNSMKTFGQLVSEGRDKYGISKSSLVDKITSRKEYVTEKDITLWEKDLAYPDITIIYMIAEILKINPTDLLEAKQIFQTSGLNAIDMVTMRVVCKLCDISIMAIFYLNRVLFVVGLLAALVITWGKVATEINM